MEQLPAGRTDRAHGARPAHRDAQIRDIDPLDGEIVARVELVERTARSVGRVVDPDGAPMAHATISVCRQNSRGGSGIHMTDPEAGAFAVFPGDASPRRARCTSRSLHQRPNALPSRVELCRGGALVDVTSCRPEGGHVTMTSTLAPGNHDVIAS